jgi:hypothetical protein
MKPPSLVTIVRIGVRAPAQRAQIARSTAEMIKPFAGRLRSALCSMSAVQKYKFPIVAELLKSRILVAKLKRLIVM